MSGASKSQPPTAKLQDPEKDKKAGEPAGKEQQEKAPAILEEDDEFEDFPVEGTYRSYRYYHPASLQRISERLYLIPFFPCTLMLTLLVPDWGPEDAEVPGGNTHLWEESWDDDDTSEDFSKQLK